MSDDRTINIRPDEEPDPREGRKDENEEGSRPSELSLPPELDATMPAGPGPIDPGATIASPPSGDPGATMATPPPGVPGATEPAPSQSGSPFDDDTPENIGPYRLIRVIGEGGMGLVYEAEQTVPLRRKVALKIVKRGMDTHEFVSRFESERQALALMDHPAIAKVFDAGATERGRPYFVMEYVEGIPITNFCDQNQMGLRERLDLFVLVCDGVQHAHQKAIIHRDLKPSNVLVGMVDGHPVPKIIDFGVAKAMDHKLFDNTLTTSAGQLVGTPEYMSPEQADMSGAGIDTRTDVYALGVILYEMLVGKLPFDLSALHDEGKGFYEILRVIREEEPSKPSTRATTIWENDERAADIVADRQEERATLRRHLKGDLDWITMKALEKDRVRRYDTVRALGNDVRRHLAFKPVAAGPPSKLYKVRKFVRRNRLGVAAGGLVLGAIILGIVGTTTGMIRARQAERKASLEAETARQVSDFLVDLFEVADPDQAKGETITAREILDQGAGRIVTELAGQPETQARLMNTIGKVYRNLGLYDQAVPQLEAALALRRQGNIEDDLVLAENLADLGDLYIDQGHYAEAEMVIREALEIQEEHGLEASLEIAASLNELAKVQRNEGRYEEAEALYIRARNIRVQVLGEDHPEVARSYNSLAILNWQRAHYDEAEELYKKAIQIWKGAYGDDHSDVAKGLNNLALLYHHLDQFDKAQELYDEAIVIYEKVLGPEHTRLATALNNLGLVYYEKGELERAYPLYEQALAIRVKALGPDHPTVGQTLNNMANVNRDKGRYEKAEELYRRALIIRREAYRDEHNDQAWTLWDMGQMEAVQGRDEEAIVLYEEAVGIYIRVLGPDHWDFTELLPPYIESLRQVGRVVEADSLALRVEEITSGAE